MHLRQLHQRASDTVIQKPGKPGKPGTTPGFLLSRHWRDRPQGIELQLWATTPDGPARLVIDSQKAVFFVARADFSQVRILLDAQHYQARELTLKTFAGDLVMACYFLSQRTLQASRQLLEQQGIAVLEGDVRPVDRFLMERFVHGGFEVSGPCQRDGKLLHYRNPVIRPGDWQPQLKVLSLDIETAIDRLELFSIGLVSAEIQQVFMVGAGVDGAGLAYCCDESQLLRRFLSWLEQYDPDVIIGWNVVSFDLWYLQRVCDRHGIPFSIGRGAQTPFWRRESETGGRQQCELPGRVVLDGIEVVKAAQYRFDSYSLQSVSGQLLGRGKLLQGAGRGQQIEQLFYSDKPALAAYNLEDCRLVWDIFTERGLVAFSLARSQLTGLTLGRSGGSVAAFDFRYLPLLHRRGFVAPSPRNGPTQVQHSPGGYVLDSEPGIYDNVLVFDFKSLYPSIIRSFFIDPLGMATAARDVAPDDPACDDNVAGFNGASFSRHQHLLPGLLAQLWHARDLARSEHNIALGQAIKILMNSFYGVLGSPGCRFFDPRLASSITLRGHQIIRQSKEYIEQRGYRVIYGDTDSLFVWLQQSIDEASVHSLGKLLAADINSWWRQRLQREMGLDSLLEVQFETHFLRFFMPTIRGTQKGSKKRYAGMVRVAPGDGHGSFELIFKGLESVRSDWTPLARRFQQELYRKVFAGEPVARFIRDTVAALAAGTLDDELTYRKRLRQPLDAYSKIVPPQVQAARKAITAGARKELYQRGRAVEYVMTSAGPAVQGYTAGPLDYEHYKERQLAPVADGILYILGTSFSAIVDGQIALF